MRIFLWFVTNAAPNDRLKTIGVKQVKRLAIKRGQIYTTMAHLSQVCGNKWSARKKILLELESAGEIKVDTYHCGTVITVLNYEYYAPDGKLADQFDDDEVTDTFERFWNEWPDHPNKVDKRGCLIRWGRWQLYQKADEIIQSVVKHKETDEWKLQGNILPPLDFLIKEQWERPLGIEPVRIVGSTRIPDFDFGIEKFKKTKKKITCKMKETFIRKQRHGDITKSELRSKKKFLRSKNERLLLTVLSDASDENGEVRLSWKALARLTGGKHRTVGVWMRALMARGEVELLEQGEYKPGGSRSQKANLYLVTSKAKK